MSNHTQEKWETAPNRQALTGVVWAGVEYICTLDESERVPKGSPEFMANARLIAAAPEMKDELARRLEYLESLWLMLKAQPYMPTHQELVRLRKIFSNIEGSDHE